MKCMIEKSKKPNAYMGCSKEEMAGMLTTALEGGSNYWYSIEKKTPPIEWSFMSWGNKKIDPPISHEDMEKSDMWKDVFQRIDYPLNKGGSITIRDIRGMKEIINLEKLRKGCTLMRKKFPDYYKSMKNDLGNCDAICSDIFLQLATWGDVIFG